MPDSVSASPLYPLPWSHAENVWRHFWHTMMAPAESLLPILPLDQPKGGDADWNQTQTTCDPAPGNGGQPSEPEPEPAPARPRPAYPRSRKERRAEKSKDRRERRAASRRPAVPDDDLDSANGRFVTIGQLFDRLDDYFYWLRLYRSWRPEEYDLYSRMGGVVLGPGGLIYNSRAAELVEGAHPELDNDPKTWPALMCVSLSRYEDNKDRDQRLFAPKLISFCKVRTAGDTVVPFDCQIYHAVVFFTTRKENGEKKDWKWPLEYFVAIRPNHEAIALRTIISKPQTLPKAKVGQDRGTSATILHREMDYNPALTWFVDSWNKRNRNHPQWQELTVEHYVRETFYQTLYETIEASKGVQITIRNLQGLTARFGIPLERTAYFFADRQRIEGVRLAPIYHGVAEYSYFRGDREIVVPEHRRGLSNRHFRWHDYEVTITEPDRHHRPFHEYAIAGTYEDMVTDRDDTLEFRDLGNFFRYQVDSAPDRGRVNERAAFESAIKLHNKSKAFRTGAGRQANQLKRELGI